MLLTYWPILQHWHLREDDDGWDQDGLVLWAVTSRRPNQKLVDFVGLEVPPLTVDLEPGAVGGARLDDDYCYSNSNFALQH